ncbi:MAG: hypothetical protein Q4G03_04515 [Planctomycetia bacterium]|nr:hypothetical protein [Planctomycetia bacterium]
MCRNLLIFLRRTSKCLAFALLLTLLTSTSQHTLAQAPNADSSQVAPLAFDFESGSLEQENWQIIQGHNSKPLGNRNVEFHNNATPYDKQGRYYLTTLETTDSENPTDEVLCIIESPVFRITGSCATFLVGGAGNREEVRVELALLDENYDAQPVLVVRGKDNQKLDEVRWDLTNYRDKLAVIRVVDQATGSWAHIRCDDFKLDAALDLDATQARRHALEEKAREAQRLEKERRERALVNLPEKILYVQRRQYRPDHHNTATIFQAGEINEGSFQGGGALKIWDKQTDSVQTLLELPEGIVRDPTLSFDAKKVLFSFRKSRQDDYHIAELALDLQRPAIVITPETSAEDIAKIQGFRQLTFIKGASDIDPIYLPTGEIVFSSTREPKYCMCNRHIMCNLYKMTRDGENIEQIGKSTLFEGHSSLLSDGRIIYDRWEYVDRNFGDAQGVWVANPDGTRHEIFWGNNTAAPGGVIDAKPTCDDDSVFVCVLGSCHDRPWGAVALIDRRLGLDGRKPVLQTWPSEAINWVDDSPASDPFKEAIRYDAFTQTSRKYEDPYPLENGDILAAGQVARDEQMGLYLLTQDGDAILFHTDEPGCFDPIPLEPTDPPQSPANRVDLADAQGYFHITNVYEGFQMQDVPNGAVKYLRVVESPEKRFWTEQNWQGSGTQAPGMAWDDFNNKRVLGVVPVNDDGSVYFAVPAEKFVYFQLLDENKMLIQSMRSGVMARPGETNACVGCHESKLDAPDSLALSTANVADAKQLQSDCVSNRLFSYTQEVQPIFDRYCVACHDYGKPAGEKLLLAGDRNPAFNLSYWQIRSKGLVKVPGAGPHNVLPPYAWGSTQSKLAQVVLNGHDNKDIDAKRKELGLYFDKNSDPDAFLTLMTWIDINAPYYPSYGSAYRDNPYGRSPLTTEETARLEELVQLKGLQLAEAILFDRPELSPCLNHWGSAQALSSPEYREALDIITKGKERLAQQDRGEDENFQPVAQVEIDQQLRYDYFLKRQEIVKDAIRQGKTLNDLQINELIGSTWR